MEDVAGPTLRGAPGRGWHTAWPAATSPRSRIAAPPCPSTCQRPAGASGSARGTGPLQRQGKTTGGHLRWGHSAPTEEQSKPGRQAPCTRVAQRHYYSLPCVMLTLGNEALAAPLGHHSLDVLFLGQLAQGQRGSQPAVSILHGSRAGAAYGCRKTYAMYATGSGMCPRCTRLLCPRLRHGKQPHLQLGAGRPPALCRMRVDRHHPHRLSNQPSRE